MSVVRPYAGSVPRAARALVWVVDDSELQAAAARSALADEFEVRIFSDGETLLEAMTLGAPDLLLVDWVMPTLSGYDLCRFVRETHDAGTLPIVILTAAGDGDLAEAFAAGANDFVKKPFAGIELVARVSSQVRVKDIHARLTEAEHRVRIEGEFRERFIAMLAHDLRQPLNTFSMANALVAESISGPELVKLVGMQGRAARRMTAMVAELLDLARSRPENGMPIERERMDLASVVPSIIEEMRVGHPDLVCRLDVQGSGWGFWDRDRLVQVCTNLLRNAIEHLASPTSPIEAAVIGHPDQVELVVSNQGTPIPPGLLAVLFQPFRRTADRGRPNGGLGLGLHIVNLIARAHGGTVSVQSDETATVFRVHLPRELAS